ncbi:hypothetical protein [Celerinatantimonas yamalensis]|uniref:Uncharacterized protein n=1 Tax=Celerinatantimonas yamalensis TaxID=559956 RepID=A0ABW9G9H7_9GAMM
MNKLSHDDEKTTLSVLDGEHLPKKEWVMPYLVLLSAERTDGKGTSTTEAGTTGAS